MNSQVLFLPRKVVVVVSSKFQMSLHFKLCMTYSLHTCMPFIKNGWLSGRDPYVAMHGLMQGLISLFLIVLVYKEWLIPQNMKGPAVLVILRRRPLYKLKGFKTKKHTQILNAVSLCMTSLFLCKFWMPKICFCLAQENLFLSYT